MLVGTLRKVVLRQMHASVGVELNGCFKGAKGGEGRDRDGGGGGGLLSEFLDMGDTQALGGGSEDFGFGGGFGGGCGNLGRHYV